MDEKRNPHKVRMLILVTQLELAGAQKNALIQARHLHSQGFDITICYLYDKLGMFHEVQQREPFKVINLNAKVTNKTKFENFMRMLASFWRLHWILRREHVQVLETLTHYSNVIGIILGWLARVPVRISSQRNTLLGFPKWFLYLDALIANSILTDKMVAISEETARFCVHVEGINANKVIVIPNGIKPEEYTYNLSAQERVDTLHSLGIQSDDFIIITVARLHHQKGYRYLVEAAKSVIKIHPDVNYLVVGDGEEKDSISQFIFDCGLQRQFHLLGVRSDIPRLLSLSNLFVLPSIYEGMPNAVLEAMAAGVPVIATNVDGTNEIIEDGLSGILIPPANPDALADAINYLIENKVFRQTIAKKGFERIKAQFSEEIMCRSYEELIEDILKEKNIGE